jgi:hypothetical protein
MSFDRTGTRHSVAGYGRLALQLASMSACLSACGGSPGQITDCEPRDGVTPICGFQNPEDLAAIPGSDWVIVSQGPPVLGSQGDGSLVAFRPRDERRVPLFPGESRTSSSPSAHRHLTGWGDASCPGRPDPEAFSPHGIDVAQGAGGFLRLAVINHGGREAVELFTVGDPGMIPALTWLGCVPMPPNRMANDVVFTPDGGLAVTDMMPVASGLGMLSVMLKLQLGADTGAILAWNEEQGWKEIEGSSASAPNGLEVSRDGGEIYFTEWAARRFVRLRLNESGEARRASIDLPHLPDNLTWTRGGMLLVAGQVGGVSEPVRCEGGEGACAMPLSVLAIDPRTLDTRVVLEHDGTAAGAASVALQVGDQLYIGSFASDRIARVDYQP